MSIDKPRVRQWEADGGASKVRLQTFEAFNGKEALYKPTLNRLLSGVSSRDFERTVGKSGTRSV